jgi:hypothetical protein
MQLDRNLGTGSSIGQAVIADREAILKMPTKYTSDDFVLIILRRPRAPTISIS